MPKTFPTVRIILKDYTRKDGTKNIFLCLTINRRRKYFPLDIYVNPDHFTAGTVSKKDPDHRRKNDLLEHYFLKARKILHDYRIQDKDLTFNRFFLDFGNNTYGSDSFYDFYQEQIDLLQGKLNPNTIKAYKSQLAKLREFRKELTFSDIDLDLITAYEGFIRQKKQNNRNTVIKSITFIKGILNRAVKSGIIKENPIKDYKLGRIQGNREILTWGELERLEKLFREGSLKPGKQNVLRYFLFACYTGMSFSDVEDLRKDHIKDERYISKVRIKTKEPMMIPLIQDARDLIPPVSFDRQKVFKVLKEQPTNRYLKDIMKDANINKRISFHCSRHTFATLSRALGIQYDTISQLVAHSDIKTTKIYTHYDLDHFTREMEKWMNRPRPGKTG